MVNLGHVPLGHVVLQCHSQNRKLVMHVVAH